MSDIDAANYIINGDERYHSSSKSIWDFTRSDASAIERDQIYTAVAINCGAAKTLKNLNLALVATDSHAKHLCDFYIKTMQELKVTWRIQVFSSIDSAQKW